MGLQAANRYMTSVKRWDNRPGGVDIARMPSQILRVKQDTGGTQIGKTVAGTLPEQGLEALTF